MTDKRSQDKGELTDRQKQILEAMIKADGPSGSKGLASATGLEANDISNEITALKKKNLVESPVRCKYSVTERGGEALMKATGRLL